jgi:hypothetical protein
VHRLEDLLQTEMTRKQFLRTVGVGLLAICGLPSILHILNYHQSSTNQVYGDGYGSSAYGGAAAGKIQRNFGKNN